MRTEQKERERERKTERFGSFWLGVKRVTEPNRTTGLYRTEPTEISDTCGTGFYRRHRTELFGVISNYLLKSNYASFKIYLFKNNLLC